MIDLILELVEPSSTFLIEDVDSLVIVDFGLILVSGFIDVKDRQNKILWARCSQSDFFPDILCHSNSILF